MVYYHQEGNFHLTDGAKRLALPRYYRDKIFADYDMTDRNIELQRLAKQKDDKLFLDFKLRNPSGSYDDYWEEKNQRRESAYRELTNRKKCKL